MSRQTLDVYAKRAKRENYPARSVYKLAEIQQKYHIFSAFSHILDVGCAPGSWSAYILRHLREKGRLVGVDLLPVIISHDKSQATFLQGDISNWAVTIKELGPYHAIVSDAAPKTTGNRLVDTGNSLELVQKITTISLPLLWQGGNFVVKVFQGGEEKDWQMSLKPYFDEIKWIRPKAVRKESCEVYLVGLGFKGLVEDL